MNNKRSLYISTAVCSALSMISVDRSSAQEHGYYDAKKKRCYGSALAGQNDCPSISEGHTCKGTATVDCDLKDWKLAKTAKECEDLIAKNCPQNLPKK